MNSQGLSKCLKVLKSSSSDNEVLSALLLVTKVAKAEECDEDTMRLIFKSIGFKLLRRLLQTGNTPEGCSKLAYKSIAISVLSCFCSLQELVCDPEMTMVLPHVAELTRLNDCAIEEVDGEVPQVVSDCYVCLRAVAFQPQARDMLYHTGCIAHLCHAIIHQAIEYRSGLELMLYLCTQSRSQVWQKDTDSFHLLMDHLVDLLEKAKDEDKFKTCSIVSTVLASSNEAILNQCDVSVWESQLHSALFTLLQNRLSQEHRSCVLCLCCVAVDRCGVRWVINCQRTGAKFLLLLVHLACIETRMGLEIEDLTQIEKIYSLLASCYSLLENVIEYLTTGPSLSLEDRQVTQLHAAMVGAFNAVLYFLSKIASQYGSSESTKILMPLVLASVRVLGSWIAEETTALRQEVISLLPFLIQISKETFHSCREEYSRKKHEPPKSGKHENAASNDTSSGCRPKTTNQTGPPPHSSNSQTVNRTSEENSIPDSEHTSQDAYSDVELLQFLMPGLCHLSAEDEPRKVLLTSDLPQLLLQYLEYQWLRLKEGQSSIEDKAPEIAMTTTCGVLLNVIVLESDLVSSADAFGNILNFSSQILPELKSMGTGHLSLEYHLMAIGLLIIRNRGNTKGLSQGGTEDFMRWSINILKMVHSPTDNIAGVTILNYHACWKDMSELWGLSMQVLCGCIDQFPWLPKIILGSKWLPEICQLLINVKGNSVTEEVLDAFQELFLTMAAASPTAVQVIKEAGGLNMARKYKRTGLEQILE